MKYFPCIICFTFFSFNSVAQDAEEYRKMAREKKRQQDFQYASILMDKAIELDKSNPWYYLEKADIQLELENSHQAILFIWQAIAIDTTFADAYNQAGSFYSARNMGDSALLMFDTAIRLAEDDTSKYMFLMNRGTHKATHMDNRGAITDLEAVLKFNPSNFSALNNISNVYDEMGRENDAIRAMKKCISLDPQPVGPYVNLGRMYTKLDFLDSAILYFDKAVELEPDQPLIYSNRGFTYFKLKRYNDAIRDINKSLAGYPSNSYAYKNLALVYLALDKKEEACTALNYAADYGFETNYGQEVNQLLKKNCKKRK